MKMVLLALVLGGCTTVNVHDCVVYIKLEGINVTAEINEAPK